jgi:acetyltransferase
MINKQLIDPDSIVVVGGSDNLRKPGGKIIQNIIAGGYTGSLYAVNPKGSAIPGIITYTDISQIPDTDLAILSIPARYAGGCGRTFRHKKHTCFHCSFFRLQ